MSRQISVIFERFQSVATDLGGHFSPYFDRGYKYILTIIDYATHYPEAITLKVSDTIPVVEALVEVFSFDLGTRFNSHVMSEIHRFLSVKALYTYPYHSACNGAVERLNVVLKSMLNKLCSDHHNDWDRFIPAVLLAYKKFLMIIYISHLLSCLVRGPLCCVTGVVHK